jgi:hypothetical protein
MPVPGIGSQLVLGAVLERIDWPPRRCALSSRTVAAEIDVRLSTSPGDTVSATGPDVPHPEAITSWSCARGDTGPRCL